MSENYRYFKLTGNAKKAAATIAARDPQAITLWALENGRKMPDKTNELGRNTPVYVHDNGQWTLQFPTTFQGPDGEFYMRAPVGINRYSVTTTFYPDDFSRNEDALKKIEQQIGSNFQGETPVFGIPDAKDNPPFIIFELDGRAKTTAYARARALIEGSTLPISERCATLGQQFKGRAKDPITDEPHTLGPVVFILNEPPHVGAYLISPIVAGNKYFTPANSRVLSADEWCSLLRKKDSPASKVQALTGGMIRDFEL